MAESAPSPPPFDACSPASYTPHVNEEFRVARPDGGDWILRLESVAVSIDEPGQLCFSLLFRSTDSSIPGGLTTVRHSRLGDIILNLALVRLRRGGLAYEAVFNLLRDGAAPALSGHLAGIPNP